jgi:hypothetical protein
MTTDDVNITFHLTKNSIANINGQGYSANMLVDFVMVNITYGLLFSSFLLAKKLQMGHSFLFSDN